MKVLRRVKVALAVALVSLITMPALAADLRVYTTGAAAQVVREVVRQYTARTGQAVALTQDTAGGVRRRIDAGEIADVIIATPEVLDALAASARVVAGSRADFARTGIGVGIRDGLPLPDISSIDAIRRLLASAPSIALPDPRAGGTSAIYLEGMIQRLGMAEIVASKARLQAGGYAADLVASGAAQIVLHQISEIRPVRGVTLVGPLPAEIQLITTYSAGLGSSGAENPAARALVEALAGAEGRAAIQSAGMDPVRP